MKSITLLVLMVCSTLAHALPMTHSCKPFLVHRHMTLPTMTGTLGSTTTLPKNEIEGLLAKSLPQKSRPRLPVQRMLAKTMESLNVSSLPMFQCVLSYISQDTDGDGIVDWTPFGDGMFSETLVPLDPDMDGDGTENIFDPEPLDPHISWQPVVVADFQSEHAAKPTTASGAVSGHEVLPPHLLDHEDSEVRQLQLQIYKKFQIVVINYTDHHHPTVLRLLDKVLAYGLPQESLGSIDALRHVYAFSGLRAQRKIATTHYPLKAIAIGGKSIYPNTKLTQSQELEILSALAHEVGHTVVFSKMEAKDLHDLTQEFAAWHFGISTPETLFAPSFFKPHRHNPQVNQGGRGWIPSHYGRYNAHEWFAEAFASFAIQRLKDAGQLSDNEYQALSREYRKVPEALSERIMQMLAD